MGGIGPLTPPEEAIWNFKWLVTRFNRSAREKKIKATQEFI